jgi:hypothetical protein
MFAIVHFLDQKPRVFGFRLILGCFKQNFQRAKLLSALSGFFLNIAQSQACKGFSALTVILTTPKTVSLLSETVRNCQRQLSANCQRLITSLSITYKNPDS